MTSKICVEISQGKGPLRRPWQRRENSITLSLRTE